MNIPLSVTVGQARRAGINRLQSISDSARLDVDIILSQAMPIHRNMLNLVSHVELDVAQQNRFESLLARRMKGEPIAYITGMREFWSLDLVVSPATLVPRPETELVVERALARCRELQSPRIADLGTGSGAIALALAFELGNADITATDISQQALKVARRNQQNLNLDNVTFIQGDWTDTLSSLRFDAIVSNPPYIREDDPCLMDIFMQHEPRLALTGGSDGLSAVRRIIESSVRYLNPDGWLIVEHGFNQGEAAREVMTRCGYAQIRTFKDLAGLSRVTEGQVAG
ncbi:MAG: peptide chain release factor N(5)-glutamine methyltransferase [Acidiferrobacterales bacterium]|nr:peptide chain release factor N(5)-glutamine methyltransferase [Acidiferrobacterales bacterium]